MSTNIEKAKELIGCFASGDTARVLVKEDDDI